MTKTFKLKRVSNHYGSSWYSREGITLCNSIFIKYYPNVKDRVNVTVSTTRQHRKGEKKLRLRHDGKLVPVIVINGNPVQITRSTYYTIKTELNFKVDNDPWNDGEHSDIFVNVH